MIHKPIQIGSLSLFFPHKICFEDFTTQVRCGDRIGIVGRNGVGKSTLLNILHGTAVASSGEMYIPDDAVFGCVPQIIEEFDSLSGGQRFNKALTFALSLNPNILLLDEPTNHLDRHHRSSLLRMLCGYTGTLIIVSHDVELLRNCVDRLWHIDNGKVHVFSGSYDDYLRELHTKRQLVEQELELIARQKKEAHQALMKEQERAKKSSVRGEKSIQQRKWPTIVSDEKAKRAIETSGKKKKAIRHHRDELMDKLSELRLPEIIIPKFSLSAVDISDQMIISIREGSAGYHELKPVLTSINFSLASKERLAITGDNGSGKSTLVKAILNDSQILKSGDWQVPKVQDIGYLDQHYSNLSPEKSVFESIAELQSSWSHADIRRHLNNFLFRKNEEVSQSVSQLSGGEKARLSLAIIAAATPKLLILDEITNNLDLETREHVIQVLKDYPAAMIVISHDEDFLERMQVEKYKIGNSIR